MEKKTNSLASKKDFTSTKVEIANLKAEMAFFKADILKWMLFFCIAQVGITAWFILLFAKK